MKKTILSLVIVAIAMMTSVSASAQAHPAYLHALSDLRAARWMIDHRPASNWVQSKDEQAAVSEIDAAINEIKRASIDDHKDLRDHPAAQEIPDRAGRLHKAVELLRATRGDLEKREDNRWANGLRDRAFHHIDEAIRFTERAIASR